MNGREMQKSFFGYCVIRSYSTPRINLRVQLLMMRDSNLDVSLTKNGKSSECNRKWKVIQSQRSTECAIRLQRQMRNLQSEINKEISLSALDSRLALNSDRAFETVARFRPFAGRQEKKEKRVNIFFRERKYKILITCHTAHSLGKLDCLAAACLNIFVLRMGNSSHAKCRVENLNHFPPQFGHSLGRSANVFESEMRCRQFVHTLIATFLLLQIFLGALVHTNRTSVSAIHSTRYDRRDRHWMRARFARRRSFIGLRPHAESLSGQCTVSTTSIETNWRHFWHFTSQEVSPILDRNENAINFLSGGFPKKDCCCESVQWSPIDWEQMSSEVTCGANRRRLSDTKARAAKPFRLSCLQPINRLTATIMLAIIAKTM